MNRTTWTITSMSAYPQEGGQIDVVFQVNWSCSTVEGPYAATVAGSVPVTYTAGEPFTPYDQLTQDQVWGWINPTVDRPVVEATLQEMIASQKNPTVINPPLPWS